MSDSTLVYTSVAGSGTTGDFSGKHCICCAEPATWEAYDFYYCEDCKPCDNPDDFDPEAHEEDVFGRLADGPKKRVKELSGG